MPRPAGHQLAQGRVCKILDEQEVKPHKLRYYLERRDTEFAEKKMAEVLCVYRTVKLLKETAAASKQKPSDAVAIIYDEKPCIQAIATTSPDLPPKPGKHATFARDHEYKRHGTVSLLAGIDLLTGKVPCPGQGSPPQPRVHRISQTTRHRLSGPYSDQAVPRQSFRVYL